MLELRPPNAQASWPFFASVDQPTTRARRSVSALKTSASKGASRPLLPHTRQAPICQNPKHPNGNGFSADLGSCPAPGQPECATHPRGAVIGSGKISKTYVAPGPSLEYAWQEKRGRAGWSFRVANTFCCGAFLGTLEQGVSR